MTWVDAVRGFYLLWDHTTTQTCEDEDTTVAQHKLQERDVLAPEPKKYGVDTEWSGVAGD